MTVSPSIPSTIEMRRSRFAGLVAAAAIAAAAITWALLALAGDDTGTGAAQQSVQPSASVLSSLSAGERRYVNGVTSLTNVEQAAAFGGPDAVLDALDLSPREKQYVRGISSLTPVERAAAFGVPEAAVGGLGFGPAFRQFVKGITSMAQAQQAAASGR